MYSREEAKQLKKEFWEGFGTYCSQVPALKNRKSKFMLYNTKMKGVELKFDATREGAFVILEINLKDEDARFERFEQFQQYKVIFENELKGELIWELCYIRELGEEVSRIYLHKGDIDIHRKVQWMEFYKYMSEKMLRLEKAFRVVKDALD